MRRAAAAASREAYLRLLASEGWEDDERAPPGHEFNLDPDILGSETMGAIKTAGFLATGGGGRLYIP